MKRALYVSAFLPSAQATHAGARVAHENLQHLRKAHGAVDAVVCTTERHATPPSDEAVVVVPQNRLALLRYLVANARSLGAPSVISAPLMHTRLNQAAHDLIVQLLRTRHYDEVFIDFTQAVLLTLRAVNAAQTSPPRLTICLHDVFVQRVLRTPGLGHGLVAGVLLREEQSLIDRVDSVLMLSPKDRDLVSALYAASDVRIKPFSAPDWCADVRRSGETIDPCTLLFFGNFDRLENRQAVDWFLANAMQDVAGVFPELTLQLVGNGSDVLARQIGHPRISGTGFVANPAIHFSRCTMAIAPLLQGAGVKFKVLEALAAGVPVVGTPVACEGIAAQALLVRAAPAQYTECLIAHLRAMQQPGAAETP